MTYEIRTTRNTTYGRYDTREQAERNIRGHEREWRIVEVRK